MCVFVVCFWCVFGVFLDAFWACFLPFWCVLVVFLGVFWAYFGFVLVVVLGTFLTCFGLVWVGFGYVLDVFWVCICVY